MLGVCCGVGSAGRTDSPDDVVGGLSEEDCLFPIQNNFSPVDLLPSTNKLAAFSVVQIDSINNGRERETRQSGWQ